MTQLRRGGAVCFVPSYSAIAFVLRHKIRDKSPSLKELKGFTNKNSKEEKVEKERDQRKVEKETDEMLMIIDQFESMKIMS